MLKQLVLTAAMGAAVGLAACEEKKPTVSPPPGVAVPNSAADVAVKGKDELIASTTKQLEDMEKASGSWTAKIDALAADAKPAVNKLVDDFKTNLTAAKGSVTKLKDATAATVVDLTAQAKDALKKATDAFNAAKAKLPA